jgi:hypothetical protein
MPAYYPQALAKGKNQGLHYSGILPLIHSRGFDLKGKQSRRQRKSAANPLSWASASTSAV